MRNSKRISVVTRAAVGAFALCAGGAALAQAQTRSADFHWDKAMAAGSHVRIGNISGDISVTPSTNGHVSVVGIKHGDSDDFDEVHAVAEQTSDGVEFCVVYGSGNSCHDDRGSGRHRNVDASIDFQVAVPANLTVSASSVSGDVRLTGTQGDIRATSVSGDVHLDRLHATSLRATTVSGDIDAEMDVLTGSGDLNIETVSGDVGLTMPKTLDADLRLTTVSGDIDTDYPLTLNGRMSRRSLDARIGKGGRRLEISTVSGDVRLRSHP
jgi:DUF4097 and DUF4098 domain-containing protein YvlB